jgi:Xaa-Pro aminopeptidase
MSISNKEYQRRYAAIRELIKKGDLDSILVASTQYDLSRGNIRYITGYGHGGFCIFPAEGKPIDFTIPTSNGKINSKLRKIKEAFDLLDFRGTTNPIEQIIIELSRLDNGRKIGIVGLDCIPVPIYLALKEKFGNRLLDLPLFFEPLRIIKSAEEIEKIRIAAAVADKVYTMLRRIIRPGLSEYEVYGEVKKVIYENGCAYSFEVIDGAGSALNMSLFPTEDKLEENGTLFMEISPAFQGYYAQLPVTLPVGKYLPKLKQMVIAWAEADTAMQKVLRPGTKVSELYHILIDSVRAKGFLSPYRPGHFVGLDLLDYWSITESNDTLLKPGMALAIHPSVIDKDSEDGVGMGYTYLITETGFERFSKIDLAKELI